MNLIKTHKQFTDWIDTAERTFDKKTKTYKGFANSTKKAYKSNIKWVLTELQGDNTMDTYSEWFINKIVYEPTKVIEEVIEPSEKKITSKKCAIEAIKWVVKMLLQMELDIFHKDMEFGINSNGFKVINHFSQTWKLLHTSFNVYNSYVEKLKQNIKLNTISLSMTTEQEKRQSIGLKKLKSRWEKQWNKLRKMWKEDKNKFLVNNANGSRSKEAMWLENTCLLGLFLNAPPRRCKDWTEMYLAEEIGPNDNNNYLVGKLNLDLPSINVKNIDKLVFRKHKTSYMGYVEEIHRCKAKNSLSTFEVIDRKTTGGNFISRRYWSCLAYMLNYRMEKNIKEKKPHKGSKLFTQKKDIGTSIKDYVCIYLKHKAGVTLHDLRHMYIHDFLILSPTQLQKKVVSSLMAHSQEEQKNYFIPFPASEKSQN